MNRQETFRKKVLETFISEIGSILSNIGLEWSTLGLL